MNFKKLGFSLLTVALCAGTIASSASAKGKAFVGTIGDALCGVEHSMPVSAPECIRQCIGKGSNYSLIVGDKVYTLETEDKTILDTLEKQAGERVKVIGTENGKTITVSSIKPAN
jgi:hypothetical protein